jgi:hypothetical protein
MTRNELLELANAFYTGGFTEREIAFARVIAAAEREACAKIARKVANATRPDDFALDKCYEIENAIRARGNT